MLRVGRHFATLSVDVLDVQSVFWGKGKRNSRLGVAEAVDVLVAVSYLTFRLNERMHYGPDREKLAKKVIYFPTSSGVNE